MPKERRPRRFGKRKRQIKTRQQFTWEYRDRYFRTERQCYKLFFRERWPEGVRCVSCDSTNVYERKNPVKFHCRSCSKGFSLFTGTYLELIRVPLRTLVLMVYDIVTIPHGVSTYRLSRCAGISYTTAHKVRHLIMESMLMDLRRNLVLNGILEADEMWVEMRPSRIP